MEATSSPVATSHILVEASPADITYLPLGENFAEAPSPVRPARTLRSVPDAKSQIFTLLSLPADKAYLPSGEKTTELMPFIPVCPMNFFICVKFFAFHNITLLSCPPDKAYSPSEEKETDHTLRGGSKNFFSITTALLTDSPNNVSHKSI